MRNISLVILVLSLGACGGISSEVPRPPVWDSFCSPSDPFYLDLASRVTELSKPQEIPSNPEEAVALAEIFFQTRGISLRPKAEGLEEWSKFTTTFPDVIYLDSQMQGENSAAHRSQVYWHEIVHIRQYETFGPKKMALLYSFSEGRWALEVQAYRESFRVFRTFGVPEDLIVEAMKSRAEQIYDSYYLDSMPRDCAINKAIEIWMLDSR